MTTCQSLNRLDALFFQHRVHGQRRAGKLEIIVCFLWVRCTFKIEQLCESEHKIQDCDTVRLNRSPGVLWPHPVYGVENIDPEIAWLDGTVPVKRIEHRSEPLTRRDRADAEEWGRYAHPASKLVVRFNELLCVVFMWQVVEESGSDLVHRFSYRERAPREGAT